MNGTIKAYFSSKGITYNEETVQEFNDVAYNYIKNITKDTICTNCNGRIDPTMICTSCAKEYEF